MRILKKELENKKIDFTRLVPYGFSHDCEDFVYKEKLIDEDFEVIVRIDKNEEVSSRLIDINTYEEYVLVDVKESEGEFVGNLKAKYEECLDTIVDSITSWNIFKSPTALEILSYAKEKYGDDPQYLWKKSPNNAVLKRKSDGKWYAAILTVKKSSLGFDDDTLIEIIDLHGTEEKILSLVDNVSYFKGYHMNKKRWFTIPLDGSVNVEDIIEHLIESHETK